MFERGHSKHLSENKVTYRAGYSKNRAGGAGPLLLLSQFCTMRLRHFMGENSQTHSFRGIHKSKAYLNVLFHSQLFWLTWTLFP